MQDELRRELGDAYALTGQSPVSASEASVEGMYYGKNVDVLVSRDGQELGVVSVKFVITNYWQNSVNYFEQQVGETANLRRRNIVYGNLFCVTDPILTSSGRERSRGWSGSATTTSNATRNSAPTTSTSTRRRRWR